MGTMLLYGDSYRNPNIYYATGFMAPDPFIYVRSEGRDVLAVPAMEKSRAQKEARVGQVVSYEDLGYQSAVDETGDATLALAATLANLLVDFDGHSLAVESTFPVLLADLMRSRGVAIEPDRDLLVPERRRKAPFEIEALAQAQARAERAVSDAIEILTESRIAEEGLLYRGVPLTAERLRGELVARLAGDDYVAESLIVAPGPGSSDPHWEGSGPIRPHQPIILDIFPRDRQSRYHGDVTRTVVKGEASPEVMRMFDSVQKAHSAAIGMISAGVNGRDVHRAVQASFTEDGYGDDGPHAARFTHGTGHGLGLEVHELPRISTIDMELVEGDVVTVEPGLYDPAIGGVRLEDVVVVTSDGHRNLNSLPKTLVIP